MMILIKIATILSILPLLCLVLNCFVTDLNLQNIIDKVGLVSSILILIIIAIGIFTLV